MSSLGEQVRNQPQGRNNVCHWMFYAKWFFQFRKGSAAGLLNYVRYKRREADKAPQRFHRLHIMIDLKRCERWRFFMGSKARVAHRPYARRIHLPPARWI